jgi:beta-galactosidase
VFANATGIQVPWVENFIIGNDLKNFEIRVENQTFEPASYMDLIQLNGAQTIASFSGGESDGKPAVTISNYGKGHILYMGTDATTPEFYEKIFEILAQNLNIEPLAEVPLDVEVTTRQTTTEIFYFFINMTDSPRNFVLKDRFTEVLTGKTVTGKIKLDGLDALVIKKSF